MILEILFVIVFLAYFLLDVNYFLRCVFLYIHAKYLRKRIQFLESSSIYGICLPSDADFLLTHMNNARFLRECDFARFDYLIRVGLLDVMMKKGGSFPVGAITTRYRQPLWMFSLYKVVTTPIYWDNKCMYLDQRIVTVRDSIVRSVGYTKIAFVKVDFEALMQKYHPNVKKPAIPADLQKWIDANELSSEKMKKN